MAFIFHTDGLQWLPQLINKASSQPTNLYLGLGNWTAAQADTLATNLGEPTLPVAGIRGTLELRMNEGTGTTLADGSGSGYDATMGSGTSWSGTDVDFDGTGNCVGSNNAALAFTTAFTVAAWIYIDSYGPAGQLYIRGICEKTTGTSGYFLRMGHNSSTGANKLCMGVYTDTWHELVSTGTVATAGWHHVATTYESGSAKLYIDGGTPTTTTSITGSVATNTSNFQIGSDQNGRYFDGKIKQVFAANRVLTATEINTLKDNFTLTPGYHGYDRSPIVVNATNMPVATDGNGKKLTIGTGSWTASGGDIGPMTRWFLSTSATASGLLICSCDLESSPVTISSGSTYNLPNAAYIKFDNAA